MGASLDEMGPSAARSSVFYLAGNVLSRIIDLWAVLLIARHFGESVMGRFSFAIAYVGYFSILIDLGFNITFVREMVRDKARQATLLTGMLVYKCVMIAVGMILAGSLIFLGEYPLDTMRLVWVMTLGLLISPKLPSLRLVYEQVFQSHMKMEIPGLLKIMDGVFLLSLVYGIVINDKPILWVMIAYIVCNIPGLIVIIMASRKLVKPSGIFESGLMLDLLRQALPVAVLGLFAAIYSRIDVLLLSRWSDDAAIGYYASAYRLSEAFRILPAAVLASLYPMLVAHAGQIKESFIPILSRGLKPLLVTLIPVCLVTTFLSESIIELFYSSQYLPAAASLITLVWAELFVMLATVLSNALIAVGRQKTVMSINGLMLLINVVLNVILIPIWSFQGAAVTRLLTEGTGVVGFTIVFRKMAAWSVWGSCMPLLPASCALLIWLYLFSAQPFSMVVGGSCIVYTAVLFATRAVTPNELFELYRAVLHNNARGSS